ncbi:truD1 [Ecytonucleospora hepatopenaei]|uniref:TruD1 n=1 Tax=Ecytonucleospora hepatopenaei TaxID=646526 RepID=A0A1W0E6J8_9MICR|nr:truD1 [Ecytonucleospora hepatopenaei]
MDCSSVEICKFYKTRPKHSVLYIKREPSDFIVQEIDSDGNPCLCDGLIDEEKFYESKNLIENLPTKLDKSERNEFYKKVAYYPFVKITTVENQFKKEQTSYDFYIFTLKKINLTTNDAIGKLSSLLGISYKNFQVSGNKDKRAITYQTVGVKVEFEKLYCLSVELLKKMSDVKEVNDFCLNKHKFEVTDCNIEIYNIRKGNYIKMGSHSGNKFTITLKNTKIEELHDSNFFINYFGLQRFGKSLNNHNVGQAVIKKDFEKAIDIIFDENNNSQQEMFLSKTHRFIDYYRKKGKSSKWIFLKMNRDSQMLYLHAYQSFIFNKQINDIDFMQINHNLEVDLVSADHKFCKGGKRLAVEEIKELKFYPDEEDVVVEFILNKSAYATMALREITGCEILDY